MQDECGTSKSCATGFVGQYARNTTWGCWYDPDNYGVCARDAQCDVGLVRLGAHRLFSCVCIRVGTVVFHRGYTVWKWFPFAVPALSILAVMVIVSDRLCARAGRQVCGPRLPTYVGRLATVVLWVGTCC